MMPAVIGAATELYGAHQAYIHGSLSMHRFMCSMDLRVLTTEDGEQWFVGADVCNALGVANVTMALRRLDEDEVALSSIEGRDMNVVSESGLYSLTLTSRKQEAKMFKRWVTSEVLPSIRKTGGYGNGFKLPTTLSEALRLAADQAYTIELLEAQRQADMPKLEFYDRVAQSDDALTMEEAAKVLGTGRNRLFSWLRDNGFLMPGNTPYQKWLDRDVFRVVMYEFEDKDGVQRVTSKTCVTTAGMKLLQGQIDNIQFGEPHRHNYRLKVEGDQGKLF